MTKPSMCFCTHLIAMAEVERVCWTERDFDRRIAKLVSLYQERVAVEASPRLPSSRPSDRPALNTGRGSCATRRRRPST